jgi:hypothetical protein
VLVPRLLGHTARISWSELGQQDSSKQKYEVQIPGDGGVFNHVGYVTEVVPTANLYDQAVWEVYGEQAQHKLNFPSPKTPSSMPAAMAKKSNKKPGSVKKPERGSRWHGDIG